jgi:predicted nuclease of restriction endonuclease-like (RecB) superfamily
VAKSKNQDQAQLLQAIGYFKALKKQAPKNNPKIIEFLDRAERDSQDALFELLESKTQRSPVNL